MGALREYEKALKDTSLDVSVRKTLLYNSCCIHAAFGDLELAQVRAFLRGHDFVQPMNHLSAKSHLFSVLQQ